MEMRKLKVASRHMAGYTGVLGMARFTDGVSDEYLPRHIRDRMAASMAFLEVDEEGTEAPAGAAYRMATGASTPAVPLTIAVRQTEGEKLEELTQSALDSSAAPNVLTREALEEIASKKGMPGLREIGARWNVKHRQINALIDLIVRAQDAYLAKRNTALAEKVAAEAERLKTTAPQVEAPAVETPKETTVEEPVVEETVTDPAEADEATKKAAQAIADKLAAAAASGDLSAALSAEGTEA